MTLHGLEPEPIGVPKDSRRFMFWGHSGYLKLPIGMPTVSLTYVTEPPHGDFLYRLAVGGRLVGGPRKPTLFWGRALHLSECRGFLALSSPEAIHVVDITSFRVWARKSQARIEAVSASTLTIRSPRKADRNGGGRQEIAIHRGRWKQADTQYRSGPEPVWISAETADSA